jgi:hypothetical protein
MARLVSSVYFEDAHDEDAEDREEKLFDFMVSDLDLLAFRDATYPGPLDPANPLSTRFAA